MFSDASQDELIAKAERIRSSLKAKTKAKSQCTAALKTYSRGVEAALQAVEKLESAEKVRIRYIHACCAHSRPPDILVCFGLWQSKEKQFRKEFSDAQEAMDKLLELWKFRFKKKPPLPEEYTPSAEPAADPWQALDQVRITLRCVWN